MLSVQIVETLVLLYFCNRLIFFVFCFFFFFFNLDFESAIRSDEDDDVNLVLLFSLVVPLL